MEVGFLHCCWAPSFRTAPGRQTQRDLWCSLASKSNPNCVISRTMTDPASERGEGEEERKAVGIILPQPWPSNSFCTFSWEVYLADSFLSSVPGNMGGLDTYQRHCKTQSLITASDPFPGTDGESGIRPIHPTGKSRILQNLNLPREGSGHSVTTRPAF